MLRRLLLCLAVTLAPLASVAQQDQAPAPQAEGMPQETGPQVTGPQQTGPMTPLRMAMIVREIDTEAQIGPGNMFFTFDDVPVTIIFDPFADRMRALVPIASAESLSESRMMRLMQANFDSALDARYAVAQGRVWSVFIHPLSRLDRRQLIGGLAQTVALAQTYGTTYSSSETLFLRGDSGRRLRELLDSTEDL